MPVEGLCDGTRVVLGGVQVSESSRSGGVSKALHELGLGCSGEGRERSTGVP
jgi:hypothetical protein